MKAAIYARMSTTFIVFLAVLLFPLFSTASDNNGYYYVAMLGKNEGSCGAYIAARNEGRKGDVSKQNAYAIWLAGYVTAYNKLEADTYNVMGTVDMATLQLWLENFCKQNPIKPFAEATEAGIDELYPIRTKQAPKQEREHVSRHLHP